MDFIRDQNTPYFSRDFDFKISYRARQLTGSFEKRAPGVVHIQGVIALAISNRPRARHITRLLAELRSTLKDILRR